MWVILDDWEQHWEIPVDNASVDSNSRMTLQKGFCKMLQMIKFAQLPFWLWRVIRIEMHWKTPLLQCVLQISPILQCKVNVVTAVLQSIIWRKLLQTDALLWLFYNFWMCIIIIQWTYKRNTTLLTLLAINIKRTFLVKSWCFFWLSITIEH